MLGSATSGECISRWYGCAGMDDFGQVVAGLLTSRGIFKIMNIHEYQLDMIDFHAFWPGPV
jgi:hypothetical protein